MAGNTLFSLGEALIDLVPTQAGCSFEQVPAFAPQVGGGPARVCAAFARLGGRSSLVTQLGEDPFGHQIARELADRGVDLSHLTFTAAAGTALAFASQDPQGGQTVHLCRKPSAELLYAPEQLDPGWFREAFALHFGSGCLVDSPMRFTHLAAIAAARQAGALVSFAPGLRPGFWPDREMLRQTVLQFAPRAHILQLSEGEPEFLTGSSDLDTALPRLLTGKLQLVVYTGPRGARAYTHRTRAAAACRDLAKLDLAHTSHGFFGCFLWQLLQKGVTADKLETLSRKALEEALAVSNRFRLLSARNHGALAGFPTPEQLDPAAPSHFSPTEGDSHGL